MSSTVLQLFDWELKSCAPRENHCPFHEVFKLTDVARPVPFRQSRHGCYWNPVDLLLHPTRVLLREIVDEQRNVFGALT